MQTLKYTVAAVVIAATMLWTAKLYTEHRAEQDLDARYQKIADALGMTLEDFK